MSSEVRQQSLFDALREELSGAQALRAVLEREADVLKSLQVDDLDAVVEDKRIAVAALQAAAEKRNAAVTMLGFAGSADGVVAFMDTGEPTAELRGLWRRLETEIGACAELNRHNEIVNRGGQRRIQQLMRLLRGESAEPLTYEQLARNPAAGL
ncbi:flagella synthesis protein FlgN [Acidihalobacter prosperus]